MTFFALALGCICGDVYRTAHGISGVLCRSQLSVCRMLVSDQHGDRECLLWGVKQLESGEILYFDLQFII